MPRKADYPQIIKWSTNLEFHTTYFINSVIQSLSDYAPGNFVLALCRALNGMSRHVVETDHILQHSYSLVEGTESKNTNNWSLDMYKINKFSYIYIDL